MNIDYVVHLRPGSQFRQANGLAESRTDAARRRRAITAPRPQIRVRGAKKKNRKREREKENETRSGPSQS